ncbi:oxygenase MpaB family protein [Nonomuraea basaltis]|uniref:oxygenase MpaB family protein n=1 Tax=Nonomuraea basaltis TaxID=2495887 RepID=UPI00110C6091|nr:oxygenase MpaB family protein [Nonomuraea basaltis]TMR88312.1 DUF2236 domain-containing protein [Nonomuraea basaltis]
MTSTLAELQNRVAQQKTRLPAMYGAIDFGTRPERFTDDPAAETAMRTELAHERPRLLADTTQVATIEAFTMLGDTVADAYAALLPHLGFRTLVDMLDRACDLGIDAVTDPPAELVALITDMEYVPDWIDMDLVREGARLERNSFAHAAPYAIRGAFVGTFLNTYAALPMALTGALDQNSAAQRIKETAAFFSGSVLPGALDRHGAGFKAAAKVRLMHSMVRYNILRRSTWDSTVYGIPIPQADQMPAGLITAFQLSLRVLRSGRQEFTPDERALIEFARYRAHLLGLPEELLPDTPRQLVDVLATRHATLRKAYDDATCGALVRATMAAYLEPDTSFTSRIRDRFERSFSKAFFIRSFLAADNDRATQMGIGLTRTDKLRATCVGLAIGTQMALYHALLKIPATANAADARLIMKLNHDLHRLGRPAFTTNAAAYPSTPHTTTPQHPSNA